jgi:ATP-dependent Clp protease adaptor protein ClpS
MSERGGTLAPERIETPFEEEVLDTAKPWNVVVWNDPINLMSYVTYVFRKVFGYSKAKATKLMLQVHYEGRAIVSSGPLERAEIDAAAMHHHGLWATLEQP